MKNNLKCFTIFSLNMYKDMYGTLETDTKKCCFVLCISDNGYSFIFSSITNRNLILYLLNLFFFFKDISKRQLLLMTMTQKAILSFF